MVDILHKLPNCIQGDEASVCMTEVGLYCRYHMITRHDIVDKSPNDDHSVLTGNVHVHTSTNTHAYTQYRVYILWYN